MVTLHNQEWKTLLESRHQGQYNIARATWCGDHNEPSSFLNMMLSESSSNTTHYKSAELDKLMVSALSAKTKQQRAELYQKAESQLDKDSVIVPVYHYVNALLVKPYVGGIAVMIHLPTCTIKTFTASSIDTVSANGVNRWRMLRITSRH